ncbi:hypothetical protein C8F04DRAFT_1202424, partial [Mycena alexandri]
MPPKAIEVINITSSSPPLPDYCNPGIDDLGDLEPHIKFSLSKRLREELALRDPPQPFPADPLPEEPGVKVVSANLRAREAAILAAKREDRYRRAQSQFAAARALVGARSARARIRLAKGKRFDPTLIEDRDYALDEVTGSESRFHLRLVRWYGV